MPEDKPKIIVVAAIIEYNNQILCVQRGQNKYDYISEKFEFPGGKVEPGETEEEAIKREIKEELSLDIEVVKKFLTVDHIYPHFELEMHSYLCKSITNQIVLHEHQHSLWLSKHDLKNLDWAGADIPIVDLLVSDNGFN